MAVHDVRIKDIPDAVLIAIMRAVADYTVGFLRIEGSATGKNLALLGSGTLVVANGIHAILTAHHVVTALPERGELGLVVSERQANLRISIAGLNYVQIDRGKIDEAGPDLGAVILTPAIASSLGSIKSFHNLDIRRTHILDRLPPLADGLWIAQGFVDEWTKETINVEDRVKEVCFYQLSSSGMAIGERVVGKHDYLTLPVVYSSRPTEPQSYGGTSGGGLWQVPLRMDAEKVLSHDLPILSGVAFYQELREGRPAALRCHGRNSVYDVAYNAIASSPA